LLYQLQNFFEGVFMERKFYVAGMSCEKCENKINTAVSGIAGVSSCVANATKAQVLVNFDESISDLETNIEKTIADLGFDVLG